MNAFFKKIIFPIFVFVSVFLIIIYYINDYQKTTVGTNYTLKAYKNTVALYNGERIIDIYDGIVLNTLPQKDIRNFKSGIPIESPEQAAVYLEDFDS